jgi:hypothetical protein
VVCTSNSQTAEIECKSNEFKNLEVAKTVFTGAFRSGKKVLVLEKLRQSSQKKAAFSMRNTVLSLILAKMLCSRLPEPLFRVWRTRIFEQIFSTLIYILTSDLKMKEICIMLFKSTYLGTLS